MGKLWIRNDEGRFAEAPMFQGADGKSAYDAAVEAGYTGTEQEFYTDVASIGLTEQVLAAL